MKKDIEWLKREVPNLRGYVVVIDDDNGDWEPITTVSMKDVYKLIDQLDEPETLSQEWINEHSKGASRSQYVWVDDLQNLLVPKQELPVIPKFVADYIDDRKEVGFPIYQAIRIVRENSRFEHSHLREWLWTNKGQETFVRAWLDGYKVEEEPKYIIDTDDIEISDGNHYLTNLTLSKDSVELPIVGYKSDAIRFDDINQAQAIASYVGGRVEELEE